MKTFKEWLLIVEGGSSTATRGKIGLYPPLYTQVFNYPPQDVITWSADSFTYMFDADSHSKKEYSHWGKFKPYFWQDDDKTAEEMTQRDPNHIPKSLL